MQLETGFRDAWGESISFDQFMVLQGEVFRDVVGRRTLRFVLGEASYFIKIHTGIGWREIFKNLFQGKLPVLGAGNEVKAIRKLEELGVETMTIVGYGERGLNPAKKQSFIITKDLRDTVSLEDLCATWTKQTPSFVLKKMLITRVAGMARALHENGINHRDFYICHFLLKQQSVGASQLHLYLIDLHRAQIRSKTPERWLLKDLAGLYFSAMDIGLTRNDLYRFLREYRGLSLRKIFSEEKSFWGKVRHKAEKLYVSYTP